MKLWTFFSSCPFPSYLIKVPQQDAPLKKSGPPRKSEEPGVIVTVDSGEHIEREANLFRLPDAPFQGLDSSESVPVILVVAIHFGWFGANTLFKIYNKHLGILY